MVFGDCFFPISPTGQEHLTVVRRLAARKALKSSREHFSVKVTFTPSLVNLFKENKTAYERLIKKIVSRHRWPPTRPSGVGPYSSPKNAVRRTVHSNRPCACET